MPIQPENWEAVKALFEAALNQDSAHRSSFLKERCPDTGLRAEVERLLTEYDQAGGFLSKPALGDFRFDAEAPILPQRLSEGEVLAGRFRIVCFIASGGMGEVYEAEDQELRERVAVKTIRPEILARTNAVSRFKREVHLARQVTHPNVCRIFDLFRHKSYDRNEEVVFISMELLRGKTLSFRLREGGRMSIDEALPLIRQIASALAAAHEAGIVHRDLKPGNVVLVGTGEWRAVVTDFGLALRSVASDETASLPTGPGLLGTPAYMSPEQIEGRPATTASDIYALGLVVYEMVTGARPFQGDTPISEALKRLSEMPIPPRRFEPKISARLESVILRCLERDPEMRFLNADEVSKALASEDFDTSSGRVSQKGIGQRFAAAKRLPVRGSTMAGLVLVVVAIAVIATYLLAHQARNYAAMPGKGRRSVAVLGFKNLSGRPDEAWLSTALSEMLTTELGAGDDLRTISGENVARMKIDLSLPDSDSLAGDTLRKIYRNLGSDVVVSGSYLDMGGQVRVDLRLQDAVNGETISSLTETGPDQQLLDLVNRAGAELRQKCGVAAITSGQAAEIKASFPANIETTRLYAEGLAKLRLFDAPAARKFLESALIADPNYALAHAALSSAWASTGNEEKSREEAGRAFELAKSLSREDRLWIEGQYRHANHESERAIEIYQSLFHLHPDNLEYGLSLAELQTPKDALGTIETLRRLPAPERDDPRIDLREGWDEVPDWKRALAATSVATTKAKALGARFFVANSLNQEGALHIMSGSDADAKVAWEQSKEIYSALGDRNDVATLSDNLALLLMNAGEYGLALTQWEESLKVHRDNSDEAGSMTALSSISTTREIEDDLPGAMTAAQDALQLARNLNDGMTESQVLMEMGDIAARQGDLALANGFVRRSISLAHGKPWAGMQLLIGSMGLLEGGDIPGAKVRLREASRAGVEGSQIDLAIQLKLLQADILLAEGNTDEAKRESDEANIKYQHESQSENTQASLITANILLAENRWPEAESVARRIVGAVDQKKPRDAMEARIILSFALLRQGKIVEAGATIAEAEELCKKFRGYKSELEIAIVSARIMAAHGDSEKAAKQLSGVIAEATKTGFVHTQLNARLALGEIQLKTRDNSEHRGYLRALEGEAYKKGYRLISRKAAAARKT